MYSVYLQPVLSDITSHQRLVDSVIEKAQGVLHTTSNPEVAAFITDINSRYEELCQIAKVSVLLCQLYFPSSSFHVYTSIIYVKKPHRWYNRRSWV